MKAHTSVDSQMKVTHSVAASGANVQIAKCCQYLGADPPGTSGSGVWIGCPAEGGELAIERAYLADVLDNPF